ncbi:hypothetical protein K503DRAFT_777660 [Rhizopogon vinicolor AM-OR11-026]|uniref:Uncharacterized protein n=1 Tax=Rhizopogon vinicolor AM-OR11-026 TaxID=1314800 RepID=A0A1B7MFI1_9AGAM|nr:hypothetical protein K503DRAFT_777660 [Rhizopogon vinicolor AM-OR11-026]
MQYGNTSPDFLSLSVVTVTMIRGKLREALLDRDHVIFAPFLNVTALLLDGNSAADIITVIQHSQFPSLKQFDMYVDTLPWEEVEQLCRALSQCNACRTLEQILIFVRKSPGNILEAIRHTRLIVLQLLLHSEDYSQRSVDVPNCIL